MTLKMTVMGAVLAAGLIGGITEAKADVVRVNVGPARVHYVRAATRGDRGWDRSAPRPAVVAPRFPRYGYGARYGVGYVAADAQNPSVVAAQIRAEMAEAAEDLRFDVRQGVVERRALAALDADREEIERDLGAASRKGYITADDRAHLEQHVQEIRDLRTQLRCAGERQVTYAR